MRRGWQAAACAWLFAALGATTSAAASPLPATLVNETRPTTCAEEDNVSLVLRGEGIRRFRVEALQPDYIDRIDQDATAPDFSGCNFDGSTHPTDPAHRFTPRQRVLHDGPRWRIVGITLPTFWRPQRVPVQVGTVRDRGFHFIQVFRKAGGAKPREAIVLYPSDGYWRLKPLPLARFGDGVYGSSVLLGPVTQDERPIVDIASIRISLRPLTFHLRFADGGHARIDVQEVSPRRTALEVNLAPATRTGQPFAVLRSMYVTPDNADMSEVRWQASPQAAAQSRSLPEVGTLEGTRLRFGRSVPSRHNTSAPDIEFSAFDDGRSTPRR